jgi:hypothetical protein
MALEWCLPAKQSVLLGPVVWSERNTYASIYLLYETALPSAESQAVAEQVRAQYLRTVCSS